MINILGKTVRETIPILIDLYKENSGSIRICTCEGTAPVIGLYFHEGNGYLVTTNPIMEERVLSFSISGKGYYKDIKLFTRE